MKTFRLRKGSTLSNAINYIIEELGKDDVDIDVKISPHKTDRSISQNNLYWKWITLIGNELGYTKDEMHCVLADMFLEPITYRTLAGEIKSAVPSTTRLKVGEFSEYLNKIEMMANQHGIVLPHPEDIYYEAIGG